jgi:hypothetical protein
MQNTELDKSIIVHLSIVNLFDIIHHHPPSSFIILSPHQIPIESPSSHDAGQQHPQKTVTIDRLRFAGTSPGLQDDRSALTI